jgi:hypothetical protein
MKGEAYVLLAVVVCGLLIVCGCATYKITHELERPIDKTGFCQVGEIKDELPAGFAEEDKPTFEQIDEFKRHLRNALEEKRIFSSVDLGSLGGDYEVAGGIRDFKKGSGFVRFLGLFGAGNARVMAALRLEDRNTGETLFAGNFRKEVTSYMEKGDVMFEWVAKDFAKALEKQIKKLEKKK